MKSRNKDTRRNKQQRSQQKKLMKLHTRSIARYFSLASILTILNGIWAEDVDQCLIYPDRFVFKNAIPKAFKSQKDLDEFDYERWVCRYEDWLIKQAPHISPGHQDSWHTFRFTGDDITNLNAIKIGEASVPMSKFMGRK